MKSQQIPGSKRSAEVFILPLQVVPCGVIDSSRGSGKRWRLKGDPQATRQDIILCLDAGGSPVRVHLCHVPRTCTTLECQIESGDSKSLVVEFGSSREHRLHSGLQDPETTPEQLYSILGPWPWGTISQCDMGESLAMHQHYQPTIKS